MMKTAEMPTSTELSNDISECAGVIDDIDDRIAVLLRERFRYSRHIGALKAKSRMPSLDPQRINSQKAQFVKHCIDLEIDGGMALKIIVSILDRVIIERVGSVHEDTGASDARDIGLEL